MSDHEDHDEEPERTTSPMQPYTTSQVGIGVLVLLIGLVVTFGVPVLLG
jgi:hypothetical protein